MAFCQNCGAVVEGQFCAQCGAAQGAGPSRPISSGVSSSGGMMADNVASALCYALGFITGILFLVLEPYKSNRLIRFHAFQSIFMHVAVLALLWFVIPALSTITGGMFLAISPLAGLAVFGLWVYVIFKTYQGQKIVLPVIGPLAEKQA